MPGRLFVSAFFLLLNMLLGVIRMKCYYVRIPPTYIHNCIQHSVSDALKRPSAVDGEIKSITLMSLFSRKMR